jgi:hypothetical protein
MAYKRDIIIEQGAVFSANVATYTNATALFAVNVATGYTANAAIKRTYEHGNTAATFNVWIMAVPDTNMVNIQLNSANTIVMNGKYVYDVVIKKTSTGVITRVVEGTATVTPGVAR